MSNAVLPSVRRLARVSAVLFAIPLTALLSLSALADDSAAGVLGQSGSGERGQSGSGERGQSGSGERGQSGSGERGQSGSGGRAITVADVLGQSGSGGRGQSGSGERGQSGSGERGQSGSGERGQSGSGERGQSGSGERGQSGSGERGQSGSGSRAISVADVFGQSGSGGRAALKSGAMGAVDLLDSSGRTSVVVVLGQQFAFDGSGASEIRVGDYVLITVDSANATVLQKLGEPYVAGVSPVALMGVVANVDARTASLVIGGASVDYSSQLTLNPGLTAVPGAVFEAVGTQPAPGGVILAGLQYDGALLTLSSQH